MTPGAIARPRAARRRAALGTLAALAITALAGCGSAPRGPVPPHPVVQLGDAEVHDIGRILQLEDARRFDSAAFLDLAGRGSVEVRRRTALAAGSIGDTAAVPLLLRFLDDDAAAVRADAAFALGELGDSARAVVDALRNAAPPHWVPVRDDETTAVVEVVAALGKIGSERSRDWLSDALLDAYPATNPRAARIAGRALLVVWRTEPTPGTTVLVARYLDHPDPGLRWRAAYSLMRTASPDATRRLLTRADDPDHRVRAFVARGLAAARADSAGIRDTARTVLTHALDDLHPHVRINALRALAGYGSDAPRDAIADRLHDADDHVAVAATAALAALGADAASGPLARLARDESAPAGVRAAALAALAPLDPPTARTIVEAWSTAPFTLRYGAARALAGLGWVHANRLLAGLIRDDDRRVAVAAIVAAGEIAADSTLGEPARQGLRQLLLPVIRSDGPRRRTAALRALQPLLGPEDVPALLDAYRASIDDSAAIPAAIAAVEDLGRLARDSVPVADTFFAAVAQPDNRWVRRAVAEHIGDRWGAPPPAIVSGDPAFYTAIARQYVAGPLAGAAPPEARIATPYGTIVLQLLAPEAPLTVHNFVTLARAGFYDDGVWHRVVPNFVLQDGAPAGDPSGGPGWAIPDEINRIRYDRGVLGMALSGPDTGGSQWFITLSPQPHLDGGYTAFGWVLEGMDVADRVLQGDPIPTITIRW